MGDTLGAHRLDPSAGLEGFDVDDAHSLYAAAASTDKQIQIVPGSAHGSGLLEDPSLKATVWSFIAAHTR